MGGGTPAQWAMLIIEAVRAIKFLVAVTIGYKVLSGLSWYAFAQSLLDRLPRVKSVKEWTPQEYENFWNRSTPDFNSGGG